MVPGERRAQLVMGEISELVIKTPLIFPVYSRPLKQARSTYFRLITQFSLADCLCIFAINGGCSSFW